MNTFISPHLLTILLGLQLLKLLQKSPALIREGPPSSNHVPIKPSRHQDPNEWLRVVLQYVLVCCVECTKTTITSQGQKNLFCTRRKIWPQKAGIPTPATNRIVFLSQLSYSHKINPHRPSPPKRNMAVKCSKRTSLNLIMASLNVASSGPGYIRPLLRTRSNHVR